MRNEDIRNQTKLQRMDLIIKESQSSIEITTQKLEGWGHRTVKIS